MAAMFLILLGLVGVVTSLLPLLPPLVFLCCVTDAFPAYAPSADGHAQRVRVDAEGEGVEHRQGGGRAELAGNFHLGQGLQEISQ